MFVYTVGHWFSCCTLEAHWFRCCILEAHCFGYIWFPAHQSFQDPKPFNLTLQGAFSACSGKIGKLDWMCKDKQRAVYEPFHGLAKICGTSWVLRGSGDRVVWKKCREEGSAVCNKDLVYVSLWCTVHLPTQVPTSTWSRSWLNSVLSTMFSPWQ